MAKQTPSKIQKAIVRLRALVKRREKLDTPAADRGFQKTAKRRDREAYKRHDAANSKADRLAYSMISMPAKNPADMLSKIEAIGVLVDRTGRLAEWQPELTGYICDDAAVALVVALRADLRSLRDQ